MNREILRIAFPSIAANITTPLLGLVDTAIVGHLGSAIYIGAIAVGGVMFNMLYWLFSFLRAGTSGLAAQAYGAGNQEEQQLGLLRSLSIAIAIGVVMILLQWPLELLLRWFIEPDPDTFALAGRYFRILIYGAPAVLGTLAVSGWLLGMQNSRSLVVISIVVNLTNITLSLVLVFIFHLTITGVACGTLVAQWIGFATALLMASKYHFCRPDWKSIFQTKPLVRFFRVNIEVMGRTICLIAVTLWFTKLGARQGAVILAVNTLLMQLFLLFSYMMDGFAYAAEALAGKYAGAKDMTNLHRCVKGVIAWGVGLSAIFTAGYLVSGEWFLGILTNDVAVIKASSHYYLWAVAVPFAGFAAFAWDGVFIGTTLTRQLLVSMMGAMAVFFAAAYLLIPHWGNHGLWCAFILYLLARGVIQTFQYQHQRHAHKLF